VHLHIEQGAQLVPQRLSGAAPEDPRIELMRQRQHLCPQDNIRSAYAS
jgi:hypothetical protein